MAAAVAGVGVYLWGWETSTKIPELTHASGQAGDLPKLSTSVESLKTLDRDLGPAAAIGPVPSVDATQWLQTVSPSVNPPPVVAEDTSLIAAKMKARMQAGVELVTYGEIATARKIFELVAQAGGAAGAFALAETYDPLELGGLRLPEGIKPDVALARTWYERARSLGSPDARDRLSRLAQLPQ
jgi:TPR repeat protein